MTTPPRPARLTRVGVVVNPVKVDDAPALRRALVLALRARGCLDVDWRETTPDNPGDGVARALADSGVDQIIVAGGDGTVRVVCHALAQLPADAAVPLALIPSGTTNLLARNLQIPLERDDAIRTALDGDLARIDVGQITLDDDRSDGFAVMAGLGKDGDTFAHTDETLKSLIGHAAYFFSAAREIARPTWFPARVVVDGEEVFAGASSLIEIGNVGRIQGGFEVIPGASPDDGLLDVLVSHPKTVLGWLHMSTQVLLGRRDLAGTVHARGRRVEISVRDAQAIQMDGDHIGTARRITATVRPAAVTLRVPR